MAVPPTVSEATPLLHDQTLPAANLKHELVYQRFSVKRKQAIVGMVSATSLLPLFMSGAFVPCIPQIAEDLGTTGAVASLAVSVSILALSLGALMVSTYSGFYGRRPVYLSFLPLSILGSIGVGSSTNITQLLIWRALQAIGVSPGLSVGAGVIGDIYKLEERGTAMGVFFAAMLLGPALAPLVGGVAQHYASWRWMQVILASSVGLIFLAMFFFFPETSHPGTRGIDKAQKKDGSYKHPIWRPLILNPFGSLALLRSPNLLAVGFAVATALVCDYTLLVPIAYTIGKTYNIKNEAFVGACFIPNGVGAMIGAPIAGRLSDRVMTKWKAKRGRWYPEDRLRASLGVAATLVPLSVLVSGFVTTYVKGTPGLVLNLLCLFTNGLGVNMALGPCAAYTIDVVHSQSAESMAASSALRSLFLSCMIPWIIPMIETHGVLATDAAGALFGWISFGLLWLTIQNGDRMRAWIDVGYSDEDNN